MSNLKGKVALVTGSDRGIGKAIALRLAQDGAFVISTAVDEAGLTAIKDYFKEAGYDGAAVHLWVDQEESREKLLMTLKELGKTPDILVNNAGITKDNLFMRMKDEEWLRVIDVNLNSIFHMSKLFIREMIKARWGRIVNIASIVGVIGNPGQTNYCSSKAGMLGFTKSLAQEVASRGITVNAVAPGFIDTVMTQKLTDEQREVLLTHVPMKRMGLPEDVASAVSFLVSSDADYMTGQTLHINGGMAMF